MPKTPEERRAYSRAYYAAHKEQCRGYHKKWAATHDWKGEHPTYKRNWERNQTQSEEYRARKRKYNREYYYSRSDKKYVPQPTKINRAHNHAFLKVAVDKCEFCGATETLVRHHPDYDYPLIVVVCCKSCHGYIHAELKTIVN